MIASCLAAHGANIGLMARSRDALEQAAGELRERFPEQRVQVFPCDVADTPAVAAVVQTFVKEFGRLDVLVNNAGITRDNLVMRLREEDWDEVLATNLKGVFNTCKAAARHMLKNRAGRIINITSVVGLVGNAGQTNYAASKGGVNALTKSLAKEVAAYGIRVNAVAPGYIQTDILQGLDDEQKKDIVQRIPLGRLGDSEDVAGCVQFLISQSASYMTGQIIVVDGGLVIH